MEQKRFFSDNWNGGFLTEGWASTLLPLGEASVCGDGMGWWHRGVEPVFRGKKKKKKEISGVTLVDHCCP